MTGGAACAISEIPGYKLARDRTKMWSFASTHTPPSSPVTHRSGSGLGHDGSTSNRGPLRAGRADCALTSIERQNGEKRTTAAISANAPTHLFVVTEPSRVAEDGATEVRACQQRNRSDRDVKDRRQPKVEDRELSAQSWYSSSWFLVGSGPSRRIRVALIPPDEHNRSRRRRINNARTDAGRASIADQ